VSPPVPELSVLIPFVNDPSDLAACLGALAQERERASLEVLVVERHGGQTRDWVAREYPWVELLSAPPGTPIPALRALGFDAARAPSVAVIEDHVIVPAGWTRQLLEARARGERVIGGSVENAATDTLVDWASFLCEYHHMIPPIAEGPVPGLPGNNTVYDRELLVQYRDVIAEGRWEDRLHQAIRDGGVELYSRPEIVVGHAMHYTVGLYTSQRYLYSRAYAGSRFRGASLARRIGTGLAAFALPPMIFWRVVTTVWRKHRHRNELVRSLPLLGWFTLAWAAGEIVGYWFGPGDAFGRVR
jgi:hypothetical protein